MHLHAIPQPTCTTHDSQSHSITLCIYNFNFIILYQVLNNLKYVICYWLICKASGLIYLAELVEEYAALTKKIIRYAIFVSTYFLFTPSSFLSFHFPPSQIRHLLFSYLLPPSILQCLIFSRHLNASQSIPAPTHKI